MKQKLQFLLCFVLLNLGLMAQSKVTGTVKAPDGETLVGVTVLVKGTGTGTVTDIDGNFELMAKPATDVLEMSYTGYEGQSIVLAGRSSIDVTLAIAKNLIDEIVVTSFGQSTREKFTGSAASISSEKIGVRPISNVGQVLVGAAAGVQATFGSGQPGSAPNIRIRGFGSVNSSNDPLYVVDGVPFTADISALNANDIENVTILKDAASTSLYGSRAANGVVMITTKKGKRNQNRINVAYTIGQSSRSLPEYDLVGTSDYYPLMWETYRNSLAYRPANPQPLATANANASRNLVSLVGYNVYNVPNEELVGTDGQLNPNAQILYQPEEFDWISPLMRNGSRNDLQVNFSGATEDSDYFVSFSNLKDNGFLIRSSLERYTGKINYNTNIKSWLKTGINLGYTQSQFENNDAGGNTTFVNPFFFSRNIGPIYPVYAIDPANPGQFLQIDGQRIFDYGNLSALGLPNRVQFGGRHVIAETLLNRNDFRRNVVNGRAYVDFKPAKGLKITLNGGMDYTNRYDNTFGNPEIGDGAPAGRATTRYFNNQGINLNQLVNYNKSVGKSSFDILLGHETFLLTENTLTGSRSQQIAAGNTDLVNFTATTDLNSFSNSRSVEGYFSRLNYDFDEKYFMSLSWRRDGTSRFSPSNRWGNFYSVGAAWRIDQESFMKDINWLSNLKLRGSYGQTGNEDINTYYGYQTLYQLGPGVNNAGEPGLIQDRTPGNPNLKWETNTAADIALEFGLFKNRISGTVEAFNRESSNLLFSVPLSLSTGLTSQLANIGTMGNSGIELEMNFTPVETKDFSWVISLNATKYKNEITKMPETSPTIRLEGVRQLSVGHSLYDYFLRDYRGVNPATGEAEYRAEAFTNNTATGVYTRVTAEGDTLTNSINNARFGYTGTSPIPSFAGGFSNSFSYKGVTLSGLFVYQIGGQAYDGAYAALMSSGGYGSAKHPDILNRWQKEGDITNVPRLDAARTADFGGGSSTRWLTDATSLSIRSVNVSYNLSSSLAKRFKLAAAQVIVSGENLGLWSKRKGFNPQASFNGVTSNSYSYSRTFAGGLSLTF